MCTVHSCLNWAPTFVLGIKLPHHRRLKSEIAASMDRGAWKLMVQAQA